jgi:type VI protein secretion system component Hcp
MALESDAYVKFGESPDRGGPLNTPLPLIEGDSTDETHWYWSELRDSNFGITAADPEPDGGAGGDEHKPNKHLDRVTLKKKVDWASTQLFLKCCEAGKASIAKSKDDKGRGRIDLVTVEVCRTAGGEKFAFVVFKYAGVRVVNYSIDMSGPEPSESLELEIEKFDFEYTQTDPYTGRSIGAPRTARGLENSGGANDGATPSDGGAETPAVSAIPAAVMAAGNTASSPSGNNSAPVPATATEAAVGANFPGLWPGTGFGVLPD